MSRKTFDSSKYHEALKAWDKVHCLNCDAELPPLCERKPRPHPLSNLSKCCNMACEKAWLKKVLFNWAEFRLEIIERDNYTCRDCGYMAPWGFRLEHVLEKAVRLSDIEAGRVVKIGSSHYRMGPNWLTDKGLEVHHVKPIKDGGPEFDEANCVTLCHDCHRLGRHGAAPKPPSKAELRLQEHKRLHVSLDSFAEA